MKENKIEISNSVKQFFAKDDYHNTILIKEVNDKNRNNEYYCPMCGGILIPCALDSSSVSSYFKHKSLQDCSNESMLHWWFKNEYIQIGDIIKISVNDTIMEYECSSVDIEKSYKTSFGQYVPDVTIVTTTNETIFFEFAHTNKKNSNKYSDIWRELNNIVVEVDVKQLQTKETEEKIFSPLYYDGIIYKYDKRNIGDSVISRHINKNKISDPYRIKYLNWFIRDCMRYNTGQITLGELALVIDNLNNADIEYIPKIIQGIKCNNILDDYINYKFQSLVNDYRKYINDNNYSEELFLGNIKLSYSSKLKYGIRFNNCVKIKGFKRDVKGIYYTPYTKECYEYIDLLKVDTETFIKKCVAFIESCIHVFNDENVFKTEKFYDYFISIINNYLKNKLNQNNILHSDIFKVIRKIKLENNLEYVSKTVIRLINEENVNIISRQIKNKCIYGVEKGILFRKVRAFSNIEKYIVYNYNHNEIFSRAKVNMQNLEIEYNTLKHGKITKKYYSLDKMIDELEGFEKYILRDLL